MRSPSGAARLSSTLRGALKGRTNGGDSLGIARPAKGAGGSLRFSCSTGHVKPDQTVLLPLSAVMHLLLLCCMPHWEPQQQID